MPCLDRHFSSVLTVGHGDLRPLLAWPRIYPGDDRPDDGPGTRCVSVASSQKNLICLQRNVVCFYEPMTLCALSTRYFTRLEEIMNAATGNHVTNFTVPGIEKPEAESIIGILEERMVATIDLQLTLKHIHWNVVGPNFISVHEMLDPQVDAVREMTDAVAERIASLGGVPVGTPASVVERRSWKDYSLGKASVAEHLGALDVVYTGTNGDHRAAIEKLAELDPVSEDLLIGHLGQLEQFQWFVRAHLESARGELPTAGIGSEKAAAKAAIS